MGQPTQSASKPRNNKIITLRLQQHLLREKVHLERATRSLNQHALLLSRGPIPFQLRSLPRLKRPQRNRSKPHQTLGAPMLRLPLLMLMHQPTALVH